jgi:starvation-inducible DNA-binding protein
MSLRPNVGLSDDQRAGVVELLRKALADEVVIAFKTRNYHWNVEGPHFPHLHEFFGKQYEQLDGKIDEIAEFIRYFGPFAPGSMAKMLEKTRLLEETDERLNSELMVKTLLYDHEALIRSLREDIETADKKYEAADVADFLTGLVEDHQKMAWMLRATTE